MSESEGDEDPAGAGRGVLFLIVGPSGAGKDSLIQGACRRLAGDRRFAFPARLITRPRVPGGEQHIVLSPEAFEGRRQRGAFFLGWRAHGADYAIPRTVERLLAGGRSVVVNVSRSVVDEARARWQPLRVIHVSAPLPLLAQRLGARGREPAGDIERRLQRAAIPAPGGSDVIELDNSASLEQGIERLIAVLTGEAAVRRRRRD